MTRPVFASGNRLPPRALKLLARGEGSTLIEFAVSASVFFTVLFGIMVMSVALYSYHYVSDAAREGVRYASVRGSNAATYGNLSAATTSTIQTYVRGIALPGIKPSGMTVTTYWSADGSTWSTTSTNNLPGNYVKVNVSYQLPLNIPLLKSRTLTVNSTAVGVISD